MLTTLELGACLGPERTGVEQPGECVLYFPVGRNDRKEREPRMRMTNNLPWMGRTVVAGIVALVGLGLFTGSAAAQTMVYNYDNTAAWWNAYGCADMMTLLPAIRGRQRHRQRHRSGNGRETRGAGLRHVRQAQDRRQAHP